MKSIKTIIYNHTSAKVDGAYIEYDKIANEICEVIEKEILTELFILPLIKIKPFQTLLKICGRYDEFKKINSKE